jgi:predicted Fe-Mo cluster-binding NifX family protein
MPAPTTPEQIISGRMNQMKIAVASTDGSMISRHFGQTACFVVYEIEGETIKSREVRTMAAPAHQAGEQGSHDHQGEGHGALIATLTDCAAMLCGGIGSRAAEELKANQIEPLVTVDVQLETDEAVRRLLGGTLRAGQVHACCCNHHH